MACNNNRPSDLDVIELIGKDNDVVLTPDDVKLRTPEVTEENERNTTVVVEALPDFTHGGVTQVFYDRWDLETLFKTDTIYIATVDPAQPADVICAINAEYGTQLPIDEMVVTKVGDQTALITAKATSPSYIGKVQAIVSTARIPLSERLTFIDLRGFGNNYPPIDPSLMTPLYSYHQSVYPVQTNTTNIPPLAPADYSAQNTIIDNGDLHIALSLTYDRGIASDARAASMIGPKDRSDRSLVVPQPMGPTGAIEPAAFNIAFGAHSTSDLLLNKRIQFERLLAKYKIEVILESKQEADTEWQRIECVNVINSPWQRSYLTVQKVGDLNLPPPGNWPTVPAAEVPKWGDLLCNQAFKFNEPGLFPGLVAQGGAFNRNYGMFRITVRVTGKTVVAKPIEVVFEGRTDPIRRPG